jgi:hypothetical protein
VSNRAYLKKRYFKDPSVVSRKIADEVILVPISQKASEVAHIYTMNQVAARIWELIDGENNLHDIQKVLLTEFDISPDQALSDLLEFLQHLQQAGAVKEV